jgi:hypothetical protein
MELAKVELIIKNYRSMKNLLLIKSFQNRKRIIGFMTILCTCLFVNTYAERIMYAYDDAGNRISRNSEIIMESSSGQLRSETGIETFEETLPELKISIYPNPTHGILKVDISGKEIPENAQIDLYTINGILIEQWRNISVSNTIDISSHPLGNYLMRIVLDSNNVSNWKIIKK